MKFNSPLIPAVLILRYKRFLADVELTDGTLITVHCPNPGAMVGLNQPGNRVWISDSNNPKRKLRYTLELMEVDGPNGLTIVGINTMHPNKLAREAIESGLVGKLNGYESLQTEVKYGENSRIDILLDGNGQPPCYVEVKNVHFVREKGLHEFPDCKTARGTKHLRELTNIVQNGGRAVMLYVIQRCDGDRFTLAADYDPDYANAFIAATAAGVEALAIRCDVSLEEIVARDSVTVIAPRSIE